MIYLQLTFNHLECTGGVHWGVHHVVDGILPNCPQSIFCISAPCKAGTYRDSSMSECQPCPPNTISVEGAGLCTECPQRSLANTDKTKCGMNAVLLTFIIRSILPLHCRCIHKFTSSKDIFRLLKINPESCEGLPENWTEMKTETQFPLPPGSEVSLMCNTGYTLTGDTTVTCTGTELSFNEAPSCVLGLRMNKSLINSFLINLVKNQEICMCVR